MIRIGIIGCGKITEVRHAPEYADNQNCELVAFYDFLPARAQALADTYGGKAYDSIEALLASDVDAVSVCTANTDHAAATIAALEAGKHVLCEKPMATTLADCEAMNKAAHSSGKILMIGQNQRLAKAHAKARKVIEAGLIGDILTFRTTFGHPGPEGWTGEKNSWFFDKKRAAFGAMADLGVHKTDLIQFLMDDVIVEVSAKLATLDKKFPDGSPVTVDDNALCLYRSSRGILGTMQVSWTFYGPEDNSTVLYGTKGILRCYDDPQYGLVYENLAGERTLWQLDKMTSNEEQTSGKATNTGVINTFIEAIVSGKAPSMSGDSVIKAMRVVFAAEEAANTGKSVAVNQA